MKGRVICLVGILCIASLIVSGATAKGKPDKPGVTGVEEIEFTGDLAGRQIVVGCCPNAGPFPEYTMTLGGDLCESGCTYDGHLFMNNYRVGKDRKYIVQFWSETLGGIEIIGGVKEEDKKNKTTTVTFTDEDCVDMETGAFIAVVNFVLVRDGRPDQTYAAWTAPSRSLMVNEDGFPGGRPLRPSASELTTVAP